MVVRVDHDSRRYVSRYLGKRMAKEDSSRKGPALLSSAVNASIFQLGEGRKT
jgi:hypothetical protein